MSEHAIGNHGDLGFYVSNFCDICRPPPLHVHSGLRPDSLHCLIDFCSEDVMVSVKIINTHNPALYIYYLFPNIALQLIEAKRVKLEYMSNCLCHRFSVRCNFPCSSHPWKHLAMSRNIFSSIKSFLYLSVFGK